MRSRARELRRELPEFAADVEPLTRRTRTSRCAIDDGHEIMLDIRDHARECARAKVALDLLIADDELRASNRDSLDLNVPDPVLALLETERTDHNLVGRHARLGSRQRWQWLHHEARFTTSNERDHED